MFKYGGGAARPPLFIFGAALLLLVTATYPLRGAYWAAIALMASASFPWRNYPSNALGFAVGACCLWLLGHAILISPVHSADALYRPMILFAAFCAAAALDDEANARLLRWLTFAMAALVLLGMLQYFLGILHVNDIAHRASGLFRTPNTFGTAINLALAPMIAIYLLRGGKVLLGAALWLFAGLVVTESRGAMLALCAGIAFAALSLGWERVRPTMARIGTLLAGMAGVGISVFLVARLAALSEVAPALSHGGPSAATWLGRATWDRIDLHSATLQLISERPLLGAGASMFFSKFEMIKPDSLRGGSYFFAHNDYLQSWLEFGIVGLLLLLLVVAIALVTSLRCTGREPLSAIALACGAALATCFAHAAVDFPLHVPFVLACAGAYLGTLANVAGGSMLSNAMRERILGKAESVTPTVRAALAGLLLAWLSQPAIAELASNHGTRLLKRGEVREALYWTSVAQRFEPRQSAYYWEAGVILRDQAFATRDRRLANEADAEFAQGEQANPFDVANLLGRVNLHQRLPELLDRPAPPEVLLTWTERAISLRPQNALAQGEYVKALAMAGRLREARAHAEVLARKFPAVDSIRRLRREL